MDGRRSIEVFCLALEEGADRDSLAASMKRGELQTVGHVPIKLSKVEARERASDL